MGRKPNKWTREPGDGRGREGGRQAGTPNKIPAAVRGAMADALNKYFNTDNLKKHPKDEVAVTFLNDLVQVKPYERMRLMSELAAYVVPKLQATSLEVAQESKRTIEDLLLELSQPADGEKE